MYVVYFRCTPYFGIGLSGMPLQLSLTWSGLMEWGALVAGALRLFSRLAPLGLLRRRRVGLCNQ